MMNHRSILLLPLALAMGILCFLGTRADGREAPTRAVTEVVVQAVAPASEKTDAAPGSATEIRDYGRRESQSPGLSEFAGGHDDEVVIVAGGCCTGLLIAILVLVILL
jgi:hypothetical protein